MVKCIFGFGPRKNDEEKLDVAKEKMLEAEIDSLMTISGGISGAIRYDLYGKY